MSIVVCPGSFDPPTNGHVNVIERALKIFDKVIVAVTINTSKRNYIFTPEERVNLLKEVFKDMLNVEVDSFEDNLLVNYVRQRGANLILRGIRTITDYEYEYEMSLANRRLAPDIETFFMMTTSEYAHVSSSIIKEVIYLGGSGEGMVPKVVEKQLRKKLKK